ncbi:GNAT family N-acetyltransferase [bacterium]|nr:GNAT family N-acetyltransferase [bacterium]
MPDELVLKRVDFGSDAYHQLVELRNRWLRIPLGLTISKRDMEPDAQCLHLGAWLKDEAVGCVLLQLEPPTGILRQMAVAERHRHLALGRKLVALLESEARQHGLVEITLHARLEAAGFYEKLGYRRDGDVFEEVTVPHIAMRKSLG